MKKINWVPNKQINIAKVNELLQLSIRKNHFCNDGPNVILLQEKIKKVLKIDDDKSIICTCNAAAALNVLKVVFDVFYEKDMIWGTQSFTFPPSAQGNFKNSIIYDIDDQIGINVDEINPDDVSGIIVTNVFGYVSNIDKYVKWCKQNNKFLMFDNAATPYSFYKGSNCNNYGDASVISFHHTKPLGFGEGGVIICDKKYENIAKRIMNFGLSKTINVKYMNCASNYKMSDISAIYINQHIDNFNEINHKHNSLLQYLKEQLPGTIQMLPNNADSSLLACFCLLSDKFTNATVTYLTDNGVFARKYYAPLKDTPYAIALYNKILCIPCTINMEKEDIQYILEMLKIHM